MVSLLVIPDTIVEKRVKKILSSIFSMVWSVCAVVNEDGRKKINNFLREAEKVFPMNDTVYHYYVDTNFIQFRHWDNLLRNNQWTYNPEYKPDFQYCLDYCIV